MLGFGSGILKVGAIGLKRALYERGFENILNVEWNRLVMRGLFYFEEGYVLFMIIEIEIKSYVVWFVFFFC